MQKLIILLFWLPISLTAQPLDQATYVNKYGQPYSSLDFQLDPGLEIEQNDLVFWGYIHGSETPQLVEYKILEYLINHGFRYFMPEMGKAQAYFLNEYLKSGHEELLYFAAYYQGMRTSQDASVQLLQKWQKLYALNQQLPPQQQITVLGAEGTLAPYDPSLAITWLAYHAPENTGDPMIDSLQYFKNLDVLDLSIVSGKPVMEQARREKRPTYDYVYPSHSKYQFARRFIDYYLVHQSKVEEAFGVCGPEIHAILIREDLHREDIIYNNFKAEVLPLLQKGEKVCSVYGYAHIFQGPINGFDYIASKIKQGHPDIKTSSILGVMARSSVLKYRKLRKSGDLTGPMGHTFQQATYKGYSTSRSWDGDGLFEKLEGLPLVQKATGKNELLMLPLTQPGSPFHNGLNFVRYEKGGKRWRPDESLATTDYIQYLIYIQYSQANTPLEVWKLKAEE